jgi:hypothetical protein
VVWEVEIFLERFCAISAPQPKHEKGKQKEKTKGKEKREKKAWLKMRFSAFVEQLSPRRHLGCTEFLEYFYSRGEPQ